MACTGRFHVMIAHQNKIAIEYGNPMIRDSVQFAYFKENKIIWELFKYRNLKIHRCSFQKVMAGLT